MTKTIKLFFTIFALTSVLAACTSNTSQDSDTSATDGADAGSASDSTEVSTADESTTTSTSYEDLISGVDTVFYFEFDQSLLTSEARAALTVHAEALRQDPRSIRLEGHADERGSREYNMALGERRANAVREFLVLQGVDGSLIEAVSYGEEQPAEIGSYDSAWSKNRRVELKF